MSLRRLIYNGVPFFVSPDGVTSIKPVSDPQKRVLARVCWCDGNAELVDGTPEDVHESLFGPTLNADSSVAGWNSALERAAQAVEIRYAQLNGDVVDSMSVISVPDALQAILVLKKP